MTMVRVYQYDYFDTLLKRDRRAVEYGTADGIVARHGTILAETMKEVDDSLLSDAGFIRAGDMPPRDFTPEEEHPPLFRRREARPGGSAQRR
jgi:hypothetical protein